MTMKTHIAAIACVDLTKIYETGGVALIEPKRVTTIRAIGFFPILSLRV
jgi:hypothetical protein